MASGGAWPKFQSRPIQKERERDWGESEEGDSAGGVTWRPLVSPFF